MRTRYAAVVAGALLAPGLWAATAMTPGAALAAQAGPLAAELRAGSCADLGDEPVAVLGDVAPWAQPSEPGLPVRYAETTLDLPLADILASPHAVILTGIDFTRVLACGDLGPTADGTQVAAGLRERDGSGVSGLAWLNAADAGTIASVVGLAGLEDASAVPAPPPPDAPVGIGLVAGSCAEPGRPLAALPLAEPWAAPEVATAVPVLLSFADLPVTLGEAVGAPHAIVASLGAVGGPPLACGDLGTAAPEGMLGIGLREQNGSGYTGFAWLSAGQGLMPTSVLLAQDLAGGAAPAASPAVTGDATPVAGETSQAGTPVAEPSPVAASPVTAPPTASATPQPPAEPTATATPETSPIPKATADPQPTATATPPPTPAGGITTPPTPEPTVPPEPTGAPSPGPATTEGQSFTSAQFGFTVLYGPPWQVASAESTPGLDYLLLDSGTSVVDFIGAEREWTAPQCIDQLYDNWLRGRPGLRSVVPHAGIDAGITMRTEARAIEVWDVSFSDGPGQVREETIYAQCLVLEPGVILLTTQESPRDAYPEQAALREALYAGVTLP